ncbi:B-box zinc finger protein 20 [Zea mays]|uniref:B-box zinc finger protein 20 n=1 Tax=Zea mays TaxID=4577 RepID=A0A3L6F6V3_MAIZE|nr:B-box zinc finger protein 25 [Zea mays]PWZ28974.1 B-box zinc finger protein 20 [Zea mays]|eukprot:XP_008679027.1 B-box zinc finger protein 25 [Zea mays]
MQVLCDVCGSAPAAVLRCTGEAALCSACDRRVHRADKRRRIPLVHPCGDDSTAAAPLCDVCKEWRGLVFCMEDRAILCPDCDDPIHSAYDLTAKHTRFLLVGAKLSATLVDQAPPSPDDDDDDDDVAKPDAAPAACAAKAYREEALPHSRNHDKPVVLKDLRWVGANLAATEETEWATRGHGGDGPCSGTMEAAHSRKGLCGNRRRDVAAIERASRDARCNDRTRERERQREEVRLVRPAASRTMGFAGRQRCHRRE